ncbi:MAG: hypothetical protein A3B04_02320 [Candidatus Portnoybacteria bacterium RIFCSPLOWO2_02_FULL_39_11]|uniref:Polymerase nucleotidyl transferase domain-containing protein n=1 Tax=Candidatus Portnoybacteria bacterium RIFCSPLOWO2_02_FULL_39_11 TaxID=1802001 RepID=A0A1G2FSW8_9BACT|nr:MAG: hypothetical protein A3B04_02320 [Candidatus Portnoybacteria bacterium RIFCSPLOWO2_02_FULL_39_11]
MNQALTAPLIYYDLLERPLTALEVYRYLRADAPELSFFNVWQELKTAGTQASFIQEKNGLYCLSGRQKLIAARQKRLKLAQLKWKKLKIIGKYLALVPFLRLVAVTGSLTSCNTTKQSDFDLLVIVKKNRLWLGRLLLTGLVGTLGKRRHENFTQDRICLNCYLTENNLEITAQAKPRDFHSAQEYGRVTPVLEIKPGLYEKFIRANLWLANFLKNYPWPSKRNAKTIKPPAIFNFIRLIFEWLLNRKTGDWLEKITGQWQNERIVKKRQGERSNADQVFVSDECLMFHPRSKSDKLMKAFNRKIIM